MIVYDQLPISRNGGANRDRTDDLKLAKLALSQLSYGPDLESALARRAVARGNQTAFAPTGFGASAFSRFASEGWWARDELNVRPHAYQACALTT